MFPAEVTELEWQAEHWVMDVTPVWYPVPVTRGGMPWQLPQAACPDPPFQTGVRLMPAEVSFDRRVPDPWQYEVQVAALGS